jgi:hypothetical protein
MNSDFVNPPYESIISLPLILGYFILFNGFLSSRTIGKSVCNLENQFERKESIKRYIILILPYFIFQYLDESEFYAFGIFDGLKYCYYISIIISPFLNERRLFIHDIITNTYVSNKAEIEALSINNNKKFKKQLIIASVITFSLIVVMNNLIFSKFNQHITEAEERLDKNLESLQLIQENIKTLNGINDVGIYLHQEDGIDKLIVTVYPNQINALLYEKIYSKVVGSEIFVPNLKKVEIVQKRMFNMTLASYNNSKSKTYNSN